MQSWRKGTYKKQPVVFLNAESTYGAYKPEDQRSESEKAQVGARLELAQELLSATDVVIATPMWNWNCPAVLKAYIDAIVIPGVLGAGEGKLAGKRITVVISQGGAYGPGTGIAPGMEGLVDQKATNIATATEEVRRRASSGLASRPASAK